MPGVTQYTLKGGPCDGTTGNLTPDIDSSGQIVCTGALYKRASPAQVVSGRELFNFAGKAPTSGSGGATTRAHSGWTSLRKSVNQRFPAALRRSDANLAAALRSLNRARKVRL